MAKDEGAAETGEKGKTKPPAWMFNEDGVAYAPWMVDAFDPEVHTPFTLEFCMHTCFV